MDQSNFWGDLVRKLRHERKIAQRTLAMGVRMNRSTIRNIEDGKNRDIARIERVLEYFGYDLDAIAQVDRIYLDKSDGSALTARV